MKVLRLFSRKIILSFLVPPPTSLATMADWEKWVLVVYCNPLYYPQGFNVEATPSEIRLLRTADNTEEHETRETLETSQARIIILHYLGKSAIYETEEEFDREIKGFRDDNHWDQDVLDALTWSNYGKWDQPENSGANGECMGAWYFYHIHG